MTQLTSSADLASSAPARSARQWCQLILLPLLLLVVVIASIQWYRHRENQAALNRLQDAVQLTCVQLNTRLDEAADRYVSILDQFRFRLRYENQYDISKFKEDAARARRIVPEIYTIAYLDENHHVLASSPAAAAGYYEGWSANDRNRLSGGSTTQPTSGPTIAADASQLEGVVLETIALPVREGETVDNASQVILASVNLNSIFRRALDPRVTPWCYIEVRDEKDQILLSTEGSAPAHSLVQAEGVVPFGLSMIKLHVRPSEDFEAAELANARNVAYSIGLFAGFLASLGLFFAIDYRHKLQQRKRAHGMVMNSLNEIAAMTLGTREGMPDLLARLADLFAQSLSMKASVVSLYNRRQNQIVICQASGCWWEIESAPFDLHALPITEDALRSGEIYSVSDTTRKGGRFDHSKLAARRVRSFLLIPLIVNGRPVGTIQLADSVPNRIGEPERRMARVWAAQAAVIIAHRRLNHRLHQSLKRRGLLLQQTRRLYEVSEGIYQATTLAESLKQVCELGPRLLDVDHVIVGLCEGNPTERLRFAATSYAQAQDTIGLVYETKNRIAGRVLAARQLVTINDAGNEPSVHPYFRERYDLGSAMYAPLCASVGGEVIGVMVLLRHRKSQFSKSQKRLALAFATRAAAAIENARLLEQTTRDAETKKQLLRELNHRVKNNLAGIIGLLSTHPADLTIHARQWIERVVQRIAAMSRAHELLLHNSAGMPISDLIREIGQLSITDRSRVALEVADGAPDVTLPNETAMALTMILHELCHNANVYGLVSGGVLRVRTRRTGEDSLSIAVEDLPARESHATAKVNGDTSSPFPKRKSGIGLELVQALVSRELRGRFSMCTNKVGGKTAEIEFPILHGNSDKTGFAEKPLVN